MRFLVYVDHYTAGLNEQNILALNRVTIMATICVDI
jgi:hypothetical protein